MEEHQGERTQKYKELQKREEEIDSYLNSFEENKSEEQQLIRDAQSSTVALLEHSSRNINRLQQLSAVTAQELRSMQEDLSFKETEMQKSQSTAKGLSSGRGIFTLAVFNQGDFVVEYRGELIDAAEAEHRCKLYHNACSIFMFDFIWKRKTWCIDGALEDGSFGRLVNDEHKAPNCRMKLIEAEGKPHLCLFALKEITAGTEITYDYGGKEWPWRKEIPPTVTSTAAQESIKDRFQDQTMSSTVSIEETRERPEVQSCNITSGSSVCETAQWCKHPFWPTLRCRAW